MSVRVEYRHGTSPDALADIPSGSVNLILTDPPYGTGGKGITYGRRREDGGDRGIANDSDLSALSATVEEFLHLLSRFGVILCFAAPSKRSAVEGILENAGFRIDGFAPWDKVRPGISYGVRYAYEDCIIASHYGTDSPFESRAPLVVPLRDSSLWTSGRPSEHPNEKPVGLLRRYIDWALPNRATEPATILDPFAGIASCGVAAIAERCSYIGVECDPQWWPTAERRLADAQNRPHDDLPQSSLFGDAA